MTLAVGEVPKRPDLITVSSSCVRVAHICCFIVRLFLGFFGQTCLHSHKRSEIIFGCGSNDPLERHIVDVIGSLFSHQLNFLQFLLCFWGFCFFFRADCGFNT